MYLLLQLYDNQSVNIYMTVFCLSFNTKFVVYLAKRSCWWQKDGDTASQYEKLELHVFTVEVCIHLLVVIPLLFLFINNNFGGFVLVLQCSWYKT